MFKFLSDNCSSTLSKCWENSVCSLTTITILFGYVLFIGLMKRKYLLSQSSPSRVLSVFNLIKISFHLREHSEFNSYITSFVMVFIQSGEVVHITEM